MACLCETFLDDIKAKLDLILDLLFDIFGKLSTVTALPPGGGQAGFISQVDYIDEENKKRKLRDIINAIYRTYYV